jgi:lysozyme
VKTSDVGIRLIKQFEGLRLEAYLDAKNIWTIGYGHTGDVTQGEKIDHVEAGYLLLKDLAFAERYVNNLVKPPINQNQFDALVSFVYNVGGPAFEGSHVLKYLNLDNFKEATGYMLKWIFSGPRMLQALVERREVEVKLFNTKEIHYDATNAEVTVA